MALKGLGIMMATAFLVMAVPKVTTSAVMNRAPEGPAPPLAGVFNEPAITPGPLHETAGEHLDDQCMTAVPPAVCNLHLI